MATRLIQKTFCIQIVKLQEKNLRDWNRFFFIGTKNYKSLAFLATSAAKLST